MAGPRLVGIASVAILALCVVTLALLGTGEEGLRAVIRLTARTSLALFLLAFTASAAHRLWRGGRTRWLLVNRRYLGLSFAASQLMHLLAIAALATGFPAGFHTSLVTVIVGGMGYVFTALMAATSNDGSVAWLGPRRWSLLHTVGAYWLWFVFVATYASGAGADPKRIVPVAVLLGALGVRLSARRRRAAVAAA